MKRIRFVAVGIIIASALFFAALWVAPRLTARAEAGQPPLQPFDERGAPLSASQASGGDELPPAGYNPQSSALAALPTPIPGEALVYFVPSDNDSTATVFYLYNTDSVQHVVTVNGFSAMGDLFFQKHITIPAYGFVRCVSDAVIASPPPSWVTPAPILVNFTDFTYYASLSLPKGVKVEGYTIFNPTSLVDPNTFQGETPLRFSADPATVFLPALQK